jgi:hypothetical protein
LVHGERLTLNLNQPAAMEQQRSALQTLAVANTFEAIDAACCDPGRGKSKAFQAAQCGQCESFYSSIPDSKK